MQSNPSDINIGDKFVRQQGDGRIVEVAAISVDGFVGIRDTGGMHFVPLQILMDETFFKRLKPDDTDRPEI